MQDLYIFLIEFTEHGKYKREGKFASEYHSLYLTHLVCAWSICGH